jgi:hypothetical protein
MQVSIDFHKIMKDFFTQGLNEDLKGNYKNAINLYIKSIEDEELCLEAYLNLIGILIEVSLDYGSSSELVRNQTYTQDELNDLSKYLMSLLVKAETHFSSNEIVFWKYYKANFFDGLKNDRVKEIIEKDDSNLVPYFQLYIDDLANDNETILYYHKIEELKQFLREKQTIKNKYILSLIESAENQKRINQA